MLGVAVRSRKCGEAKQRELIGWVKRRPQPSSALYMTVVLECHESAMLIMIVLCAHNYPPVARMTGAAEVDVLHLTSYGAKAAVAVSESAAAGAEAFEAEE